MTQTHDPENPLAGEYVICQRRGHTPARHQGSDGVISHCGYIVCRYCGTHFRTVTKEILEERNTPTEAQCSAS